MAASICDLGTVTHVTFITGSDPTVLIVEYKPRWVEVMITQ